MSKLFNVFTAILLIVGSCFVVSDSQAKVCFLGEDCGSGGNFSDSSKIDTKQMCLDEGYTEKASCVVQLGKYMPQHCPYSSLYGTCCGKDYFSESCAYPLESAGTCGGKLKCVCDQDVYKYTGDKCSKDKAIVGGASCAEQVLNASKNGFDINTYYSECRCDRALYPYTPEMCDDYATIPSDGVCIATDASGNKSEYYSSCYCDRSKYPYTAAGCFPFVGDENSKKCSSGGTTYFASCKTCDAWPAENLDHVGKNGANPAEDAYEACPYAQTTGYYKILRCDDPGYRVSKDGDIDPDTGDKLVAGQKCIPIACEEAVKMFIKDKTNYALFNKNGKLVDGDGKEITSSTTKTAIIADDVTVSKAGTNVSATVDATVYDEEKICTAVECQVYSYGNEDYDSKCQGNGCECRNADNCYCDGHECWDYVQPGSGHRCCSSYGSVYSECYNFNNNGYYGTIVCTSSYTNYIPRVEKKTKYTFRGLNSAYATTYYSGAWLAVSQSGTSDGVKALKVACKKNPTVKYTASSFPTSSDTTNDYSGTPSITFYGVNLEFPNTTTAIRNINMYNAKLKIGGTLTTNKSVSLSEYSNGGDKSNAIALITGTWNIIGGLSSSGYEFNPENEINYNTGVINFGFPSEYVSSSIQLNGGQVYKVYNTSITSSTDKYSTTTTTASGNFARPLATKIKKTFTFRGPSTSTPANIYTNLQLGKANGKTWRAGDVYVNISGNLNWNMYKDSSTYTIGLSSGSYIKSTDYGSGNYARIIPGTDKRWGYCKMTGYAQYGRDRHRFLDCEGDKSVTDDNAYHFCSITNSGTAKSEQGYGEKVVAKISPDGDCSTATTYMLSNCVLESRGCHDDGCTDWHGTTPLITCGDSKL